MRAWIILPFSLWLGCTCKDRPGATPFTDAGAHASRGIANRLGLAALGQPPTNLEPFGLSSTVEVPPTAVVGAGTTGGARIRLDDIGLDVRPAPVGAPEAKEDWWGKAQRLEPTVRDADEDGWLLIAGVPGGRKVIVYRASAASVCESDPTSSKPALLKAAQACLSLVGR